jgi:glycosyltransferase involved in cell wall biosynthesis
MKKKVCVYTISKNEEKFIERWYNSVKEADIIIVGDTGSTDNTVSKLRELGVIVHEININPWRFDKARNAVMDLIPDDIDICVSIDLDEVFEPGWKNKVEEIWQEKTTRLKYNYNWSFDEYNKPAISFLREQIHKHRDYKWIHPVHEVLQYVGKDKEQMDYALGVTLNHYPDTSKSRSNYLPLLELSVEEEPDDDRNMHYLGREYMYYGMWDKSIETLQKHLNLKSATWKDERCASMRYIARCYLQKKDINSAHEWLYKAIIEAPYVREPYVEMALLEYEQQNWIACYHMCLEALKIPNKSLSYINEAFCWNSTISDLCSICCYHIELLDKALEYSNCAIKLEPNNKRLLDNNKLIKKAIENKKSNN